LPQGTGPAERDLLALEPIDRLRGLRPHSLTKRALALGLLGTALLSWAIPYSDLFLQGTWISSCHLPIGAFCLFFLSVLVLHIGLRKVAPHWAFTPAELLFAYAIMLVATGLPSFGLTAYLFPTLAGVTYYASPENKWAETFFAQIPPWFAPLDRSVTTPFFEGLRRGEHLPWGAWAVPVAAWTALALLVLGTMLCLCALIRKQWLENERLSFPLVQLPLAMVRESPGGAVGPFFRSPLMWLGFGVPLLIHTINGLHHYYPAWPQLKLVHPLNPYFRVRPWNQIGLFIIWLHFSVVGFTFLLPTQLSFSLWFFFLLSKAQSVIAGALGYQLSNMPGYPVQTYAAMQMLGAFVLICGYMAWVARPHLADIWRRVVRDDRTVDESREPMGFPTAVYGLALTTAGAVIWLNVAGMSAALALLSYALFFLIAMALTRFVAECGLLFIQAPFRPTDLFLMWVGAPAIGAANLTALAFFQRIFVFDLRAFPMPSILNAFKIGEQGPLRGRQLVWSCALGMLVAIGVSYVSFLWITYTAGGVKLQKWFLLHSPQQPFTFLTSYLRSPPELRVSTLAFFAVGLAVTWALFSLRSRFVWWPLHPVGYAMGPSWPMIQLWFSTLLGWLLKTSLMRYGGFRGFVRIRPFFLGLVLGEFAAAGLWIVIGWLTGPPGYRFFLT